jgi:hypothetical protein
MQDFAKLNFKHFLGFKPKPRDERGNPLPVPSFKQLHRAQDAGSTVTKIHKLHMQGICDFKIFQKVRPSRPPLLGKNMTVMARY